MGRHGRTNDWRSAMRKTARIRGLMVPKNRAAGLGVASCHIGSDVSFHALYVLILDMCNHGGTDLDIRKRFTSLREFRSRLAKLRHHESGCASATLGCKTQLPTLSRHDSTTDGVWKLATISFGASDRRADSSISVLTPSVPVSKLIFLRVRN